MDELDRRAKAVAPFWVGPGDDAPAGRGRSRAEEEGRVAGQGIGAARHGTKAAAPTPAKPKPPPPKADPGRPSHRRPRSRRRPPTPRRRWPCPSCCGSPPRTPSFPDPRTYDPGPELDGVAEDAIRAIRVAMSRAPVRRRRGGDGDGDGAGGFNFATQTSDGIDKDDPDYREMVKTRRCRLAPRLSPRPRRRRRRRPATERAARRTSGRSVAPPKTPARGDDGEENRRRAAAPPPPDPAWMTAKARTYSPRRAVVATPRARRSRSCRPRRRRPRRMPAGKAWPAASSAAEKTEVPGPTGAELFDRYAVIVQDKLEDVAKNLGLRIKPRRIRKPPPRSAREARGRWLKRKPQPTRPRRTRANARNASSRERAAKRAAAEKEEKEETSRRGQGQTKYSSAAKAG